MFTLINPRRLILVAAVLAGGLAGTLAVASPTTPVAQGISSTRECTSTLCPSRIWLRAPVLRTYAR